MPVVHLLRHRRGRRSPRARRRSSATSTPTPSASRAETVKAALTPRTKAIVPVHLFGNVAPVTELRELGPCRCSRTRRRPRARDSAACRAGALGDAATFSFFPSKNLPCLGDGGAIVTDDDDVAELARLLRFHGSTDKETFMRGGLQLAPRRAAGRGAARAAAGARRLERQAPRRRRRPTSGWASASTCELPRGDATAPSTSTTSTWCAREPRPRAASGARLLPRAGAPPAGDRPSRRAELPGTDEAARTNLALPMGTGPDARSRSREVVDAVRVWVDLTNSPARARACAR